MAKNKKMNKSNLTSLIKSQNKSRIIQVQGGYDLTIDEVFEESKIDKLIGDYINMFDQASINQELNDDLIEGSSMLVFALIIREFTDIGVIPEGNDIKKIYPVAQTIYNLGKVSKDSKSLMAEIIQAFDQEQIERVFFKLNELSEKVNEQIAIYSIGKAGRNATVLELEDRKEKEDDN